MIYEPVGEVELLAPLIVSREQFYKDFADIQPNKSLGTAWNMLVDLASIDAHKEGYRLPLPLAVAEGYTAGLFETHPVPREDSFSWQYKKGTGRQVESAVDGLHVEKLARLTNFIYSRVKLVDMTIEKDNRQTQNIRKLIGKRATRGMVGTFNEIVSTYLST